MKTNEISAKVLNADAQSWIEKLRIILLIQGKGNGTVKNYTGEVILLFKYYNSKTVENHHWGRHPAIPYLYKNGAPGWSCQMPEYGQRLRIF